MSDDEPTDGEESGAEDNGEGEEKSFRERVEEIREKRAEEGEGEGESREERMEEMMGGGPGGMGGGGNPFAQMMSGMMGGGPGGPGGRGPGGPGGAGGQEGGNEELVREVRQLRDEVRDATRQLQRIADAIEDD